MRPSQTMMIAQKLYEGIDLGKEGTQGLITYMRTDSTRINDEIAESTKDFIVSTFGKDFYPAERNSYEKKKT